MQNVHELLTLLLLQVLVLYIYAFKIHLISLTPAITFWWNIKRTERCLYFRKLHNSFTL